jgi:DNA adenine methylase
MNSPIKYFGGKGGGLGKQIIDFFPSHSQYFTYIEPFGGGASMLFRKEQYGTEIYNDLEENVYSFFVVLSNPKLFKKFRDKCELAVYSRQVRDEFIQDLKRDDLNIVDRAYKFFIVNRTSVNGIGGFSVTSNYLRRGMSKSISDFLASVEGLDKAHLRLKSVVIEKMDGIDLINKYDRKNVFVYADPPYHHNTRTAARYKVDMSNDLQTKLIDTLLNLKSAMVLISGYNCPEYNRLTKAGWKNIEIKVNTISGDRKPKTKIECLWQNYTKEDDDMSRPTSVNKTQKDKKFTKKEKTSRSTKVNLFEDDK